eukprot:6333977-Pyramimonas_sp.AAC.1
MCPRAGAVALATHWGRVHAAAPAAEAPLQSSRRARRVSRTLEKGEFAEIVGRARDSAPGTDGALILVGRRLGTWGAGRMP